MLTGPYSCVLVSFSRLSAGDSGIVSCLRHVAGLVAGYPPHPSPPLPTPPHPSLPARARPNQVSEATCVSETSGRQAGAETRGETRGETRQAPLGRSLWRQDCAAKRCGSFVKYRFDVKYDVLIQLGFFIKWTHLTHVD